MSIDAPAAQSMVTEDSKEVEGRLLGALVLGPELLDAAPSLKPKHFHWEGHRAIYAGIRELRSKGAAPDYLNLTQQLRQQKQWKPVENLGGYVYLSTLADDCAIPTPDNIRFYAARIIQDYQRRQLRQMGAELEVASSDDRPVRETVERFRRRLEEFSLDGAGGIELATSDRTAELVSSVDFLWRPWLPKGYASVLAGPPGFGKSALSLWLARCAITGSKWPDGQQGATPAGPVVWLECEAMQSLVAQRVATWEIPRETLLMPLVTGNGNDELLDISFGERWAELQEPIRKSQPALIIIDSLSGFIAGRDENDSGEVGEVMRGLVRLARDTGAALLFTHHLRKGSSAQRPGAVGVDELRGSSAVAQWARSIMVLGRPDPSEDAPTRLTQRKCNFAGLAEPLGFRVTETGVSFCEPPRAPSRHQRLDEAVDVLKVILRPGPKRAGQVIEEAEGFGVSKTTAYKAAEKIGVVRKNEGRGVLWSLPGKGEQPDPARDPLPF